ncbi:MAG: 30S ribosomal protein S6 [Gaiellaceae bacterium]
MQHDYEILLMLDPDLPEARQDEIVARARGLVEQGGGTWIGHDPWGRRRLAYEIEKKTDGIYHLVQFDADPATLDELSRILKITDGVLRHLPTRRVQGAHGPGRPGPEPVETGEAPREYAAATAPVSPVSSPVSLQEPEAAGPEEEE